MEFKINVEWQLTQPIKQRIDPRLFKLLASINENGSLKKASDALTVSYRFAWGLLTKWEEICGQPLVILERGRGARLSPAGQTLLEAYNEIQTRLTPQLNQFSSLFSHQFNTLLHTDNKPTLTLFASHELAMNVLRDHLLQQHEISLDLHFHGSLESLRLLKQAHCQIAGFHIPEGPLGKDIAPHFLNLMDDQKYQLIYIARRNQGLIVQHSNPKNIQTLKSLANDDVRFINRQADSGTRLLFDRLLEVNHILPGQINGYQNEEFTHLAVAAMIASGEADAGFGVASVAKKFNLTFLPVIWEHYYLAIPLTYLSTPQVQALMTILNTDSFKHKLSDWPGYDISRCGESVSFTEFRSYNSRTQ